MYQQQNPGFLHHFYRRKLPPTCVDFISVQGKKLFTESLLKGYANVYFRLASQFLTQDEPAYCGLSTLVMVLNALEVDPGRVWKAPWRFYHESMLDCCSPLDEIRRSGITLPQFVCLAECNSLISELKYAQSTPEFLNDLRETVKYCTKNDDTIVVISYSRQVLGQTGTGHFSPLGAYHEESDQVLIMDVARFKYSPHWVPLTIVRDAMLSIDKATGKPRGYVTLKLRSQMQRMMSFQLQANNDAYKIQFTARSKQWEDFLAEPILENKDSEFKTVCTMFNAIFGGYITYCDFSQIIDEHVEGNGENGNYCYAEKIKEMSRCGDICPQILSLDLFDYITSTTLCTFLLAWPLKEISERSTLLKARLTDQMRKLDEKTLAYVILLRQQMEQILNACENVTPKSVI